MRRLIVGDYHINEKAIPEIINIHKEILTHDANEFIQLGDFYDKNKPTAKELEFGTSLIADYKNKYKKVTLLRGNHEIVTKEFSAIDYLKYFGINIVTGFIDIDNNYYDHIVLYESKLEYGTGSMGLKDLLEYNYVILGHQHQPQELGPKRHHLGSIRYVSFNEVDDLTKYIGILDEDKFDLIPIKSTIKMKKIYNINQLPNIEPDNKVCLVIGSFEQFKNDINLINQWKDKFVDFKLKLDYKEEINKPEIAKTNNLQNLIQSYIDGISDKEIQKLLKESLNG